MVHVYDKAKWHFNGDFPADLEIVQAYVHTGFYLTWLAQNHLLSAEFESENPAEIASARDRSSGPIALYDRTDGFLGDDMLSDEGNAFSGAYFEFATGRYLLDYGDCLCEGMADLYRVQPSWENYDRIAGVIDQRFADWKAAKA